MAAAEKRADLKVMFINWPVPDDSAESCDLLEGTDFSDYGLAFFDPLEFARAHGMRSKDKNISAVEYVSCSEEAFKRYLGGIKTATTSIRELLNNRGVFIIRAQIPNCQFKIRKRSTVGTHNYTESVVSPFFWLEEYLGKYSFQYCNLNTIKFVARNHPLRKALGGYPVNLQQIQTSVDIGHSEVIAASGIGSKSPAITKVSFDHIPGQVYLIPEFHVEMEHVHLVDAFMRVVQKKSFGFETPKWVEAYEVQLKSINPFTEELERLDREINTLESEKNALLEKIEATMRLIDLLVETDEDLTAAARTAMHTLGFRCLETNAETADCTFETLSEQGTGRNSIIRVASTDNGPVGVDELEELKDFIENQNAKPRPKGILIGNASRLVPPTERSKWFDSDCIEKAQHDDVCLLPSYELYMAAFLLLSKLESPHYEEIRTSLLKDMIDCDTQFSINKRKYGI